MTNGAMLATHVAIFRQVRERIAAEFSLDEDDEAVVDTAEGETDLSGFLIALLREADDADASAAGLAPLIEKRQRRKARFEAKATKLRSIVHNAMTDAGIPKLTAPDFTASRRAGRAPLVIPDEGAVPDTFFKIEKTLRRRDIETALRNGEALSFAHFGNQPEQLAIRGT